MINLKTERLMFRQWKHEDFTQIAKFFSNEEDVRFVGGVKNSEDFWRLMATYIGHYSFMVTHTWLLRKLHQVILLAQLVYGILSPGLSPN